MSTTSFSRRRWGLLLSAFVGLVVLWQLKLPTQLMHAVSFARGTVAYRAAAYDDAEIHFRQALAKPAQSGPLQYNLGNALYQQGRYLEAQACYLSATRSSNSQVRASAWANLGQLYYRTQRLPNAYAAYRSALLLAPADEAIRQDFLFIWHQLLARTKRPTPVPSAATAATQPPPASPGSPSPDKSQHGPPPKPAAQLSNRDIQNIMGMINESENRVREKMNDSRQRGRKPESDEQDY